MAQAWAAAQAPRGADDNIARALGAAEIALDVGPAGKLRVKLTG
jgi:hypothetical protein